MHKAGPILILFLIVIVWGWTFVVVKEAIEEYGVLPFLAVRFTIAVLCLLPFTLRQVNRNVLPVGGSIGIVLGLGYIGQTFGLEKSSPTNTGLITGLFIVFTPLANRVLFGVRTSPRLWLAVGLSVLGLVLLTGTGPQGYEPGDPLTLAGAACLGIHVALLDRYAREHSASVLALVQLAAAALLFWVPTLIRGEFPARPTAPVWFALLLTGVVATAVGFYVQTFVQQRLSAVQASVIIMTEPIFATLFGYFLAGDRLNLWQMLGASLMMGAVFIAEFAARPVQQPVKEIA